jgi:hypothetical protein
MLTCHRSYLILYEPTTLTLEVIQLNTRDASQLVEYLIERRNMTEKQPHSQDRVPHNKRPRGGFTPSYKAFHEVYVTKDLGSERNAELIAFIDKHIAEFKGRVEPKHGIPLMLFEREQDAHKFANELSARLNILKEHITVKARKYTR